MAAWDVAAKTPKLVVPKKQPSWRRCAIVDFIIDAAKTKGPALAGFDFGLAFPYMDAGAYFPGNKKSPATARDLWRMVDALSNGADDFYAGPFCAKSNPLSEYMNAPGLRGCKFNINRHRLTEHQCRRWTRPSSVFNAVGAGSVGMGSLAGMRMLNALSQRNDLKIAIWPFDNIYDADLVIVEIFPRLYAKQAGLNPQAWGLPGFLRTIMKHYGAALHARGRYSEDETDALFSAAALRHLAATPECWNPKGMTRKAAKYEGWIFGVC